jgi:hypothetical protein
MIRRNGADSVHRLLPDVARWEQASQSRFLLAKGEMNLARRLALGEQPLEFRQARAIKHAIQQIQSQLFQAVHGPSSSLSTDSRSLARTRHKRLRALAGVIPKTPAISS